MWLPPNLYKRLPVIWLCAGLAFVAAALYMTFSYQWSFWYFGAGVSCLLWSGILYLVRSRKDTPEAQNDSHAEAAE